MRALVLLSLVALTACSGSSPAPVLPQVSSTTLSNPVEYFVQTGPNGLAKSEDLLTERRKDWPAPGWQASESVLMPDGTVLQTFAYAPWLAFTPANGDGGQILELGADGYARFTKTRDGGKPYLQCFRGGTGWIVAGKDASSGQWKELIATLTGSDCASPAPPGLGQAFTRYRLESISFKFLVNDQETSRTLSTIVSEHYDADTIGNAKALERFYFAKGYGLIRWEAWGKSPPAIDLSTRYFPVDYSEAPATGWLLNDIRTYTVVKSVTPVAVPLLQ